jgi:thiosulfate reductase cytochrome b subunit
MYLYPKWIRAWHLFNAILFIILIITGLKIHYMDKESTSVISESVKSIKWHNIAAFLLIINYILFIAGNIITKNGKYYRIAGRGFIGELFIQLKYYLSGMFKGEKRPFPVTEEHKFNPLQKLSYVIAMYFAVPLVIISGIALFLPDKSIPEIFGFSVHLITIVLHISTGFFLSLFFIIHIYSCTLGSRPTSLFTGIITGYHMSDED